MACAYLGLDCQVYMVKVSYEQKPFRREVMRTYGASVTPSPRRPPPWGGRSWPSTRAPLAPWAAPSLRRWRPPPARRATAMCWGRCSTRCCSTRASSAWRPRRPWTSTASRRTSSSAAPGAGPTWAVSSPPFVGEKLRGGRLPDHRRGARLLPQPHPGQVRL